MMKRWIALFLTVILCLNFGSSMASSLGLSADKYQKPDLSLSSNRTCPVRPTIYSTRRSRKVGEERAYDINKDFSARTIEDNFGFREYGLYLKFTPGRADNGYYIYRFDTVISDPYGNVVYSSGYDSDMTCTYGYYWYWDFYNLNSMFYDIDNRYGYIPKGVYTMDIYFNYLWAGKTQFRVQN